MRRGCMRHYAIAENFLGHAPSLFSSATSSRLILRGRLTPNATPKLASPLGQLGERSYELGPVCRHKLHDPAGAFADSHPASTPPKTATGRTGTYPHTRIEWGECGRAVGDCCGTVRLISWSRFACGPLRGSFATEALELLRTRQSQSSCLDPLTRSRTHARVPVSRHSSFASPEMHIARTSLRPETRRLKHFSTSSLDSRHCHDR